MSEERNGGRGLRRAAALTLGTLLTVGLAASPAWASAPDAPAAPTAVAGNGQITVTFTAPANDGGQAITRYTASCTSSNGGASGNLPTPDGNVAPIIVSGLTNLKNYTCTVTATNTDGTSSPSLASAMVEPALPPDAPPLPAAVVGDEAITVSFTAPNDNGSAITSYTVACISTDGGRLGVMTGPASPLTVTGVTDGDTYFCHVTATNSGGVGPASPDTPNLFPAGPPDAPVQPTVARGNRSVVVSFPLPSDNGANFAGFTATCTSTNGGTTGTQSGPGSPVTVTGLTNGKTYTCNVTATNSAGTSAASPDSVPTTPVAVPDPPAKPSVVRGIARIVVSFSAPNNNGMPITGYTVTCASSNGGVTGTHGGTHSPITITGLTNGKTYTCHVWATSVLGTSPKSPASAAVVPGTSPAAPAIRAIVPGAAPATTGTLTVSFTPGPNNGTPVTSYRVTCTRTSTHAKVTKTGTRSPIAITGLLAGSTYSCGVVALNAAGTSASSGPVVSTVGAPGPPRNATAAAHPNGLTVTFSAPADNGKPITNYHVKCTSPDGGAARSAFHRTSPLAVNPLTAGKTYSCVVTALNIRGEGAPTKVGPVNVPA